MGRFFKEHKGMTIDISIDMWTRCIEPALKTEQKRLLLELAKTVLFIDAMESNDYSKLSDSLMTEFNETNQKILSSIKHEESNFESIKGE